MAIGWSGTGPNEGVFAPVLPHPYPIPASPRMTGKFYYPIPAPCGPRSPTLPRKTLFLVNLPTTVAIVFNKTCFVNKNILEIKNKFIPSN